MTPGDGAVPASLGWAVLAALVAAMAVLVLLPAVPRRGRRGRGSTRSSPVLVTVAVSGCGAVVVSGVRGTHLAVVVVAAAALWLAGRGIDRARRTRVAEQRRRAVVDYCEGLLGELEAGQPVQAAVQRCVAIWPESAPVAAAARLGADVPAVLRSTARLPGAGGLHPLAGAWSLSSATGAGLAFAVRRVLRTARGEQALAAMVDAELASARATARLVTVLPVVVLVAAQGVGAEPWRFLLDTAPGVGCLAGGVVLTALGLGWIERIGVDARGGRR